MALLLGSALLHAAGDAVSQRDSADMQVQASVVANCRILAVRDVDFGLLNPGQAVNTTATGAVNFACTRGVDFTLRAGPGNGFDPSSGRRNLVGESGARLPYLLERDSFTGVGGGFGDPVEIPVSAFVSGADYRDLPPSDYRDTLRLTLEP